MSFFLLITIVLATLFAYAHESDNLVVGTRTGFFRGDLNDTYPDVRQFKWIPYAKVQSNLKALMERSLLTINSLQLVQNVGLPPSLLTTQTPFTIPPLLDQHAHSMSLPSRLFGH